MNEKRLCLVIPSLQSGGMERVMSELAKYFVTKAEYKIHLILYGISREVFYSLPDSVIIHKPDFKFSNQWRIIHSVKTLFYLRKTIKLIKPLSVLSFGELWNSFVLLATLGLPYSVYISDRCSPVRKYGIFHSTFRKLLYPRAAGIIAQTKIARDLYLRQFKNSNIAVIGNPIRAIPPADSTIRQDIVLMVGRIMESKNQDKLVDIFLDISMPGWKLMLVGHGQDIYYEYIKSVIKARKAEDRVFITGRQYDVDYFYSRSRIFAFTSRSEGFPNALGEAMAAGLPTVAFDCIAGPSEMIRDNSNGFLVPLDDYDLFKEKLEILMKDEELRTRFGRRANDDIRQFSISEIGNKYFQFIVNDPQKVEFN